MDSPTSVRPSLPAWALVAIVGLAFALGIALALLWERRAPAASEAVPTPVNVVGGGVRPTGSAPSSPRAAAPVQTARPRGMESSSPTTQRDAFSGYESNFRDDSSVDPAWAPTAERSLLDAAVEESLVELGVPDEFNARCMRRMCKVQMAFDSAQQANDWADLYVLGMAEAVTSVRTMIVPRPDGRTEVIIYGARAGSEPLLAGRAAGGNTQPRP